MAETIDTEGTHVEERDQVSREDDGDQVDQGEQGGAVSDAGSVHKEAEDTQEYDVEMTDRDRRGKRSLEEEGFSESDEGESGPNRFKRARGEVATGVTSTSNESQLNAGLQQPSLERLAFRLLIAAKDAGVIIGKGGKHVQDIRTASGAKLSVSEHVPGASERVVTILGDAPGISRALALVVEKLATESSSVSADPDRIHVRMLFLHHKMGVLIGKGGINLKAIQERSGCRISAEQDTLPNSNERVVVVSGSIDAIALAANDLVNYLDPDTKGLRLYQPMGRAQQQGGQYPQHHQQQGGPPMHHMGMAPPRYDHHQQQQQQQPFHNSQYPPTMMPPQGAFTQNLYIPDAYIGSIIGKGGARINEIRQSSGSRVHVDPQVTQYGERLVTITGSAEGNGAAMFILYKRLEDEKRKRGDNTPLAAGYQNPM